MFDIKGFFAAVFALAKRSPLLFLVFLLVVAVFLSAPLLAVYRKLRAVPVVGSALPAK